MANAEQNVLSRAGNFRTNLRRIFRAGVVQARVAQDARVHPVHLAKILNGKIASPGLATVEALAVALEIPMETLISHAPSDVDLRIFRQNQEMAVEPS